MKKCLVLTMCVCGLLNVGSVWAQTPQVTFVSPGPGINAPFSFNEQVESYGKILWVAGFSFDTWCGYPTATGTAARYAPTLENDNAVVTAMPNNQDWALEITYGLHVDGSAADFVFAAKAHEGTADEKRVVALQRNGDDTVSIMAGTADNTWSAVTTIPMTGPDLVTWKTFLFHYKSASGKVDVYVDGMNVSPDVTVGHGDHQIDFIQMQGANNLPNYDRFRQLKLGQVSFEGPSAFNVQGTVVLSDHSGNPQDTAVRVELRQEGATQRTERMLLSASGQFSLANVATGTYDVAVKANCWLQKVLTVTVDADHTDLGTFTLVAGDNDGDNAVTSSDLSVVLKNLE